MNIINNDDDDDFFEEADQPPLFHVVPYGDTSSSSEPSSSPQLRPSTQSRPGRRPGPGAFPAPWTPTRSDIIRARFVLSRRFPLELADAILKEAQYFYIVSSKSANDLKDFKWLPLPNDPNGWIVGVQLYLSSHPVTPDLRRRPIVGVRIIVEGHGHDPPQDADEEGQSAPGPGPGESGSWYDARIVRFHEDAPGHDTEGSWLIARNRRMVAPPLNPPDPRFPDWVEFDENACEQHVVFFGEDSELVRTLRDGDRVGVFAMVKWAGRRNFIRRAQIDFFHSVL